MAANTRPIEITDPEVLYPGVAEVNQIGAKIAVGMLEDLRSQVNGVWLAELSHLKNSARKGKPFQNVLLECLQRARAKGADAEAGFCAILTDYIAEVSICGTPDLARYRKEVIRSRRRKEAA